MSLAVYVSPVMRRRSLLRQRPSRAAPLTVERLRRGQEYLLGGLDLLQHVAAHVRIQLRERVVQQQHRRACRPPRSPATPRRAGARAPAAAAGPASRTSRASTPSSSIARSSRCGPTSVCPRRISSAPRSLERSHEGRRLRRFSDPAAIRDLDLEALSRRSPDTHARSRSAARPPPAGAGRSTPCRPRPAARPRAPDGQPDARTCSRRLRCSISRRYRRSVGT